MDSEFLPIIKKAACEGNDYTSLCVRCAAEGYALVEELTELGFEAEYSYERTHVNSDEVMEDLHSVRVAW